MRITFYSALCVAALIAHQAQAVDIETHADLELNDAVDNTPYYDEDFAQVDADLESEKGFSDEEFDLAQLNAELKELNGGDLA